MLQEKSPFTGPRMLITSKEKNTSSPLIASDGQLILVTARSASAGAIVIIDRL